MVIGFTGTRTGMNELQKKRLKNFLKKQMKPAHTHGNGSGSPLFLHGDCVGADEEAHEIARELGMEIHIRPCDMPASRAYVDADVSHPAQPPLVRNKAIVQECTLLVAAPKEGKEQLRSGTWATVRYAKQAGKPVILIRPESIRK